MKLFDRILETIPHVLICGALFAFMGYIIPFTYFNYFDKTQYYKITSPVEIEQKEYKPCDKISAYINRTSLIDGQGDAIINLTLIREDEYGKKLDRIESTYRKITLVKGDGVIITHWGISCLATPGKYYYDGVIEYEVRGIKKYTAFRTELFEIHEDN